MSGYSREARRARREEAKGRAYDQGFAKGLQVKDFPKSRKGGNGYLRGHLDGIRARMSGIRQKVLARATLKSLDR